MKSKQQYYTQHKRNHDDDEDGEDFGRMKGTFLGYFEQVATARKVTVFLDEQIQDPEYYRPMLYKIQNLGQNDEIEIIVNTPGGRLDSAISIINAIQMTDANVVGVLDNQAHSAGSLILLSCPNILVAPNSSMMLHSYSMDLVGKSQEIMANAAFNDTQIKKMMAEVYLGFLTEKELGQLFNGTDFWMNSEEVVERLQARNKTLQKIQKKAEQEQKQKQAPKPKKAIPKPEYEPEDVAFNKQHPDSVAFNKQPK